MTRSLAIHKYGGTSVGSTERLSRVANRVGDVVSAGQQVIVVVSAMGETTDQLVQLSQSIGRNTIAHTDAYRREYDQLLATGETVSAALLAMALQSQGYKAVSLTGAQAGIQTELTYSRAKIQTVKLDRIYQELATHDVVIVTGFQGVNARNDTTTIGRGGSDTSAVVLAAALSRDTCDIYTDVDGVYTADPRIVPHAKKLAVVNYDDMLELASLGAKVLHPRAVECAKLNTIILHVRSSLSSDTGTLIKEVSPMEINKPVTGITLNEDTVRFAIEGLPDTPGTAAQLFTRLADQAISVDMIIQSVQNNTTTNTITFTVDQSDASETETLMRSLANNTVTTVTTVTMDDTIAKLSVVGVGMISRPGVAATVFRTLGEAGINIHLISTSEIKISCVINRSVAKQAVQLLHDAFSLHHD